MFAMMKTVLVFLSLASVAWAGGIPDDVGIQMSNGKDAFPGQFPYMVAIQNKVSGEFLCGGVLIHPSWAITDSKYFEGIEESQVVLGLHDFDDFENGGQPEVYEIEQVVREPSFLNYILLVKLSRPVNPNNPFIETIALAPQDGYDYVGGDCYHCGWGYRPSNEDGGVLQYSSANIIAEGCPYAWYDEDIHLCVVDEDTATCGRDDGGPLVCTRDDETYLVGTLRSSAGCNPPFGSLYHRVYYYSDWIRAVIA